MKTKAEHRYNIVIHVGLAISNHLQTLIYLKFLRELLLMLMPRVVSLVLRISKNRVDPNILYVVRSTLVSASI